jgi:hypothetical protein
MVVDGEEMVLLRLWSCCSISGLFERGLEGALADLRWQAMLIIWKLFFLCVDGGEWLARQVAAC